MLNTFNNIENILLYSAESIEGISVDEFEKNLKEDFGENFKFLNKNTYDISQSRISVEEAINQFELSNLKSFVFDKNSNFIDYIISKDKRFLADLLASFSEMLMQHSNFRIQTILNAWQAHLFHLEQKHFRVRRKDIASKLHHFQSSKTPFVLFIAGAQNYQNILNRVEAGALVFSHIYSNQNCKIILSGRNNQRYDSDLVEMPNESWFMLNSFAKAIESKYKLSDNSILHNIYLEQNSSNSQENIKELLRISENVDDGILIIVSSTNHINRLYDNYILQIDKKAPPFKQVFLVGSEIPSRTYPTDHIYFKQLLVEVFAELNMS